MIRPTARAVALSTTAALALAGCSTTTLRVSPPEPAPNEVAVCTELHAHLPERVLDEPERETAPDSDLTAAWGDIVLRCGVDRPAALDATSQLFEIEGVDWFAQPLTKGTRFTTVGRDAYVEVDVSRDYEPEADVLLELAEPVKEHVPDA